MRRAAACAVLGLLPLAAGAAELPLWEAGIGAGALRLPLYRGSAESQSWLLPVPYFVYRGRILKADRDGARAVLLDAQRVDVDLSLGITAPAESRADGARRGMPDLRGTLEFGPKLNLNLYRADTWKVDLRLPLRAGFTLERSPQFIGWTAAPVLNVDTRLAGFNVGLQGGPLWGDRRLHQHFYGVAPQYASAARPAYVAAGGYAGWQATAAFSRREGRLWMGGYLRTDTVAGAVFEPSPLVTQRRTWSAGFAMAWVLATSARQVEAEP